MNKIIIAFLISMVLTINVNAKPLTDSDKMQHEMTEQYISFMWRDDGNGVTIVVFNNVDPTTICDIALEYPTANVVNVTSYNNTDITAKATCDIPK